MSRLRLWGFSWRLLLGFAVIILITIFAFSFLLMGRIENYLLHDMENAIANQVKMAKGSIEFAMSVAHVTGIEQLRDANLEQLQEMTKVLASETGCRILMTDNQGVELVDSAGRSLMGTDLANSEEINEAVRTGYGAASRVDPLSGQYSMFVAYPVKSAGGEVLGVLRVSKPTSSVTSLLSTIRDRILFSGLIAGVAAILASVVFAFVLASPVKKINEAAMRFGRGDLKARSRIKGRSELAELSRSFDRMADRIERTVDELAALDDLKSAFVANVSHELKTPLTAIRGLSETLMEGAIDDESVNRKFVEDIMSESERLLVMVNNLLNLSRIEAGAEDIKIQPLDVPEVIDEVVARLSPISSRKGVRILLNVTGTAPMAVADRPGLDQAITNILDNAIKFSEPGDPVTVTVESISDAVSISVTDTGAGMSAEELEHATERFYSGKPKRGSGLGLAIARHNLEEIGGTLTLQSTPGKGTTAVITIPLSSTD